MDKKTKKILIIWVIAFIMLRMCLLFFVVPNLSHLEQYKQNSYFSFIHEGDEGEFYDFAKMIYRFDFQEAVSTMGFPIMIVPFLAIFGENFSDVFFPLILFNALILFSLSIALIVWLSFLIFKKMLPAVLSGFLFVVFPFIFYIFRSYGPQFETGAWNDTNFFHMNWLSAMADQPAAFFALLVLFLFIVGTKKEFGVRFYFLIGFLGGFATLIRLSGVMIVFAGVLTIFLYEKIKKYQKLFVYGLSSLVGFLPQLTYNAIFYGSPTSFGYQEEYNTAWVEAGSATGPMWDFGNFFHLFSRAVDYSWLAIPAFLMFFAFITIGFLHIRKNNKYYATAVLLWFLLPTLFYVFFETGQTAMRYYLPAVAPFIILSVATLCIAFKWFKMKFLPNETHEGF